jgi:hypothetical protein
MFTGIANELKGNKAFIYSYSDDRMTGKKKSYPLKPCREKA